MSGIKQSSPGTIIDVEVDQDTLEGIQAEFDGAYLRGDGAGDIIIETSCLGDADQAKVCNLLDVPIDGPVWSQLRSANYLCFYC